MNTVCKHFNDLSNDELYEILRNRVNVFVVEQKCPYPEIDGKDKDSYHIYIEDDGKMVACARIMRDDESTARIGRVLTVERGKGLGLEILRTCIEKIKEIYDPDRIVLESQTYAIGFYEKEGFKVISDEFMDDGIMHVDMELVLRRSPKGC